MLQGIHIQRAAETGVLWGMPSSVWLDVRRLIQQFLVVSVERVQALLEDKQID
jgi:hypothetical protein